MNHDYSDQNSAFDPDDCPVLLITDQQNDHRALHDALVASGFPVSTCSPSTISAALGATTSGVVLMASSEDTHDHLKRMCEACPHLPILAMTETTEFTDVMSLIEAGAWDFVHMPCPPNQVIDRLCCLSRLVIDPNTARSEVEGVKALCRRLCSSNQALSRQFAQLQSELEGLQSGHDAQIDVASTVSAFQALLSQELGIEGVLQTALEFILGKTGPTNAAIFLADSPTSYSLGAYVNFDCPREQADPILNKFARDVCHHVAGPDDLVRFEDVDAFIEAVGVDAEILKSSEVIGMPCCFDDECLAVVFLFRSQSEPFPEELAPILDSLRGALAEQLATIVNIHHRIADHWPEESSDESSDWGFGTGGNKAA